MFATTKQLRVVTECQRVVRSCGRLVYLDVEVDLGAWVLGRFHYFVSLRSFVDFVFDSYEPFVGRHRFTFDGSQRVQLSFQFTLRLSQDKTVSAVHFYDLVENLENFQETINYTHISRNSSNRTNQHHHSKVNPFVNPQKFPAI